MASITTNRTMTLFSINGLTAEQFIAIKNALRTVGKISTADEIERAFESRFPGGADDGPHGT